MTEPLIYTLLDKLFERQIIDDKYMMRWILHKKPTGEAWYLHHIFGSDWSRDLHDHPKRFTSYGLWGRYWEETGYGHIELFQAPWKRTFRAAHRHRLILCKGETVWTLCHTGPIEREWGFWRAQGDWIQGEEYLRKYWRGNGGQREHL